ncbi:MAG: GNAT family N-acetyltransferase [Micromonosporaceae bacterium]
MGRRVVIRRVIGSRDGRPQFTDLLGELVAFDDTHATVRTADGAQTTVPREQIAAAKPVPPRRVTTRQVVALERVAARGWPAVETAWLGDWLLRAAGGWTNRANTVLPLGDPGMPVPDALDHVHEWYAARDLAPRCAVPLPGFEGVDRELAHRGWRQTHAVMVQTAPLSLVRELATAEAGLPAVTIADQPDPEWLEIVAGRKGSLPPVAVRVLTGADRPAFASVYDSGRLLAIGRGVVDDDWLGLSLLEVLPGARRRGLARHVVSALAEWAAGHGARRAYLQLEEDNPAATALYAGLGFTTHHRYLNRAAP